jgi:ferredoxin
MNRKIIKIDDEKCNGCGLCITGCHEGALQLVNGKATLISDSYCDGLGACLPVCPTSAISMEEREAEAFDEKIVLINSIKKQQTPHACGCQGSHAKKIERKQVIAASAIEKSGNMMETNISELGQWPCQIKLVPPNAAYFENANILLAADCTAFAYANIHADFMKNKITLIGCPKLDEVDYSEKLTQILSLHDIKSLTVLRMEVPCCAGITAAAKTAIINSKKMIPWRVVIISTDGQVIEQ